MHDGDNEPVFVRSRWGTSRYVFNPRSPVGLALIVIVLVAVLVTALVVHNRSSWSADKLGRAVARATASVQKKPTVDSDYSDYSGLIADAVEDSGAGPGSGVRVEATDDAGGYEITADGTDAVYCMRVAESPAEGMNPDAFGVTYVKLAASVSRGGC